MPKTKKEKPPKKSNGLNREHPRGPAPIFSSPGDLAKKLRGFAFALTPYVAHLEAEHCPLIAEELSKIQKKLEGHDLPQLRGEAGLFDLPGCEAGQDVVDLGGPGQEIGGGW